ncbi:MAG: TonB-dependent receptor, partial [Flavipsychrobacter sp.]|nr:TonB-dependent receptor [Flavipsychrobacter sp.]
SGADRWEQTFYQYSYEKDASAHLGAEYNISRNHTAGIQLTEQYSHSDNNDNSVARAFNINSNMLDSVIRTNGTSSEYLKGRHSLNLNYEWRIDSAGKKLNVDADYYTQAMQRSRSFFTQGYARDGSTGAGSDNTMGANPAITIKSAKMDVEWPLRAFALSFGGKAAMVDNAAYNEYKLNDGSHFIVDTTRTNEFAYHEETRALYANGQRSIGKFDMQAGLRSEWTTMETYSATTGERHKTDYQKFFPSGYLQYKINDNNVISINYSRRINRPGYGQLNPFRSYFGPNFYSMGNPALRPSFSNGMELTYRLKGHYSFKIFGKQTDNYWDRLYQIDATSGATVATRANIGLAQQCGVNVSAQLTIKKWWEARGSVNCGYGRYKLHYYMAETTLAMVNQWFDINNTFFLNKNKTLSAEIFAYYYTPRQKDYKVWADQSTFDINFRWLLLDKNLTIAVHFEDLMAKAYWLQTNAFNGTREYSYDNARGCRLSVTYKFGNKNVKIKLSDHSNEEIQRVNQ